MTRELELEVDDLDVIRERVSKHDATSRRERAIACDRKIFNETREREKRKGEER